MNELLMGGAVPIAENESPLAGLKAGSVVEFMAMPAGQHTATFRRGTKAAQRTVKVDRESAMNLNQQLQAVNASGKQRAFFDFDHEDKAASAWPVEFTWRDSGVFVRAELSQAGAEAIAGKNYRSFSPVFYVTPDDPAKVLCKANADLNFGSLVNDPAFKEISPLWAKNAAGASSSENQPEDIIMKTKVDELQTAVKNLETEIAQLKAKNAKPEEAATVAAELRSKEAQLESAQRGVELEQLRAKNTAMETAETTRKENFAKTAVEQAVREGQIAPKDDKLQAKFIKMLAEDESNIVILAALPKSTLAGERVTDGTAPQRLEAKEGPKRIVQAYEKLCASNRGVRGVDPASLQQKAQFAREMAAIYITEMSGKREFLDLPLMAASAADTLGTLSGTLVAQRTLEFFRINYPMFKSIYTDFSDQPGMKGQIVNTRIVAKPAVQTYSETLGADGRPQGWSTASAATTTNANVTLDEHVGVPVVFDANTLASTTRRLFDEQAPAMSYALAAYFVAKLYAKCTAANFNGYAAISGIKVPVAYATYAKGILDFARSAFADLNAIFNPNEVPLHDRCVLLNSQYFAAAGKDPSLVTFWAGQRNPELITEGELPKMSKFVPIEAPDFPASNNRVGIAMQKSALIAIARIPQDYSKVLPGASYGNVTMVSDPETGMAVMLVEYVNHTGGYAEMRMETMIGADIGDKRAGLILTSQ